MSKVKPIDYQVKWEALKVRLLKEIHNYDKAIRKCAKARDITTVLPLNSEREAFVHILNVIVPQIESK